ncbi:ankyrin repeat domain-containing protein [Catellatospora sichuanensis]|uniref:ankyrin repeat domain-containing protein n=1 Tax=Catellatospora sichuanensis TaxID=1969805 RepID=UPI0016434FEE|nr:ankyrin repeat domain-containing protein [Catellatospora sichuanensis]
MNTPLHVAAQARDHNEVVRQVAAGAAIDACNYRKYTPLHVAAGIGAADMVAYLLSAGANPSARTTFETTALHEAASGGGRAPARARLDIIDDLLAGGCPIDAVDSTGRTALWYAAASGTTQFPADERATRYLVLEHLLARGADPTIAASSTQGRPVDAAQGLHQPRRYRFVWIDAVDLLQGARPPD